MNFWGFTAAVFVSKSEMHQLDGKTSVTNLRSELFYIFMFFYSSPS